MRARIGWKVVIFSIKYDLACVTAESNQVVTELGVQLCDKLIQQNHDVQGLEGFQVFRENLPMERYFEHHCVLYRISKEKS